MIGKNENTEHGAARNGEIIHPWHCFKSRKGKEGKVRVGKERVESRKSRLSSLKKYRVLI